VTIYRRTVMWLIGVELETVWNEAVMLYFKIRHLPGWTDENYENGHSAYSVSRVRFEVGTSQIQFRSLAAWSSLLCTVTLFWKSWTRLPIKLGWVLVSVRKRFLPMERRGLWCKEFGVCVENNIVNVPKLGGRMLHRVFTMEELIRM
jgi:hypothetical protein